MTPLNGVKTHSLSEHAREKLQWLAGGPQPRRLFNPGVSNRLEREGLAECFLSGPSSKSRKGHEQWLRITDAGRAALEPRHDPS